MCLSQKHFNNVPQSLFLSTCTVPIDIIMAYIDTLNRTSPHEQIEKLCSRS